MQSGAGTTKWDNLIKMCDGYYKMWYLLQSKAGARPKMH